MGETRRRDIRSGEWALILVLCLLTILFAQSLAQAQSPNEGTIGTRLVITGSDFGTKKGRVLIGNVALRIEKDSWQPDSINCTVVRVPPAGIHDVTIKPYHAKDITLPDAFTVKPPEIDSLNFYQGIAGDPITITGNFFSTRKGKVYLEEPVNGKKINCKVIEWSVSDPASGKSLIRFIVPKLPKKFLPGPFTLKVSNSVGSDSTTFTVSNEQQILLRDDFPGFSQDTYWDDRWTTGIGKIAYDENDPGFVRLQLDGPGGEGIYHNAEKVHYGQTATGLLYCDLDIRCRNSNNNGWDAPGAPGSPDPIYGLGSRGWGFWNSSTSPADANIIWFTSISPESDLQIRGTRIWVIRNGTAELMQDLNIDLTQWHIYRIQWRVDHIRIFVDDMSSPVAEVIGSDKIPDSKLNFTVWVDNYGISGTLTDQVRTYLPVPDIDQYIDVDYVRIYTP